ncbi:MAG: cell division protein ZapA [Dongiaceae bacterium]
MANVPVAINGRSYELTCNDGQEHHLKELANDIARRVDDLVKTVGQAGESRLLLMVSLLIADELAESNAEIERLQNEVARGPAIDEAAMTSSIERLAKQIQAIAARVEAA